MVVWCFIASDGLPKKSRAKSGSHHENFVAVDNIVDNVLTDFSHVHVKDPNMAESRLSGIMRKKLSRYHSTNSWIYVIQWSYLQCKIHHSFFFLLGVYVLEMFFKFIMCSFASQESNFCYVCMIISLGNILLKIDFFSQCKNEVWVIIM